MGFLETCALLSKQHRQIVQLDSVRRNSDNEFSEFNALNSGRPPKRCSRLLSATQSYSNNSVTNRNGEANKMVDALKADELPQNTASYCEKKSSMIVPRSLIATRTALNWQLCCKHKQTKLH